MPKTTKEIIIDFNIIKNSPRAKDFIGTPKYDNKLWYSQKEYDNIMLESVNRITKDKNRILDQLQKELNNEIKNIDLSLFNESDKQAIMDIINNKFKELK